MSQKRSTSLITGLDESGLEPGVVQGTAKLVTVVVGNSSVMELAVYPL